MNGFFSKVARLAASKAAAFGYAVAVGVTGNIAFNYVQPHAPPPATAAAVATRPAPEGGAAGWANPETTAPAVTRTHAAPAATHAERPPAAPPRPAARHQTVASAPVLPEPPAAVALPGLDALPPPPFKPAALPSEAALRPSPVSAPPPPPAKPPVEVPAASRAEESPPAAPPPAAPTAGTLLPLGPAIEVEASPTPPTVDALARPAPPVGAVATAAKEPPLRKPPSGFAISDLWHPGRAVGKGLHWAGRQVPLIGDADPPPRAAVAAPAAPTSLLPAASDAAASGHSDIAPPPRKPGAPGPGSGGLY